MQKRHGRLANYLPFRAGVTFVATQTKLAGKVVVISAGHLIGNHLNPPIFPVHFDIGMSLKENLHLKPVSNQSILFLHCGAHCKTAPQQERNGTMTDLNSMSRGELVKLRADVDRAIATLADRERKKAREAAERVAAEHGFSLAELTGIAASAKKTKSKSAAKYRNPANPAETWSGRGRRPRWIVEAAAAGRNLSDFQI
jgi:DNA-binding protein H-NS